MKIWLTLNLIFIAVSLCVAQESESKIKKSKLGVSFSTFGTNDIFRKEELLGAPRVDGEGFYAVGLSYVYAPSCDCLGFETGLEYAEHKIHIVPNLFPDSNILSYNKKLKLVSIPIMARANLLKYIFFNGGFLINYDATIDSPVDNQSGIGGSLGLGVQYDFKFGVMIFVNCYFKSHLIFRFNSNDNLQKLSESGVKFGLLYRL